MSRKTKRLEKDNLTLTRKHEQTSRNIAEMAEERIRDKDELEKLYKKETQMRSIIQSMREQGRGIPQDARPQMDDDEGTESDLDHGDEEDEEDAEEDEDEDPDEEGYNEGHGEHFGLLDHEQQRAAMSELSSKSTFGSAPRSPAPPPPGAAASAAAVGFEPRKNGQNRPNLNGIKH